MTPKEAAGDPGSSALVLAAEAALRRHAAAGGVPELARHAAALRAPVVVRVLGGAGSGHEELASALSASLLRRSPAPSGGGAPIEFAATDVDAACGLEIGGVGAVSSAIGANGSGGATPAPDVEIFAWCTAPCAHELRLLRRPRRHPAFVVATRAEHWKGSGAGTPEWAAGVPALRTGGSIDVALGLLRRALLEVPAARVAAALARLERDCLGWSPRDPVERAAAEVHGVLSESVYPEPAEIPA
ncbi:hypothetical protein [Dietzia sp.]|uniref:hypothetical protein n=1 Tax=Dietzia sp. TaxID=1871616 RepID=UPI002FDA0C02